MEATMKPASSKLPPILRDNEDLRNKIVRYCTQNVMDLNMDNAREYIIITLLPAVLELTIDCDADNHQQSQIGALKRLYKVSKSPSRSTIWEWLTYCGFKNDSLLTRMSCFQTTSIERSKRHATSSESI